MLYIQIYIFHLMKFRPIEFVATAFSIKNRLPPSSAVSQWRSDLYNFIILVYFNFFAKQITRPNIVCINMPASNFHRKVAIRYPYPLSGWLCHFIMTKSSTEEKSNQITWKLCQVSFFKYTAHVNLLINLKRLPTVQIICTSA